MSNLSIATDVNNDIFVDSNGNLAMASDVVAVQQDAEHALKAQFGEMFLDPLDGMPTLQDVWNNGAFSKWIAVARATLTALNGVVRVESITYDINGDVFSYAATFQTVYSPKLLTVSGKFTNG